VEEPEESRLLEVMIGGQRRDHPPSFHDEEAYGIAQRIGLV
jgi:hypothetical protein